MVLHANAMFLDSEFFAYAGITIHICAILLGTKF